MEEGVPGLTSKVRQYWDTWQQRRKRISGGGNNLSKGEGASKPQEEQVASLTVESVPGKDCSGILNSEHFKDPALIMLLDTGCGKVI